MIMSSLQHWGLSTSACVEISPSMTARTGKGCCQWSVPSGNVLRKGFIGLTVCWVLWVLIFLCPLGWNLLIQLFITGNAWGQKSLCFTAALTNTHMAFNKTVMLLCLEFVALCRRMELVRWQLAALSWLNCGVMHILYASWRWSVGAPRSYLCRCHEHAV